MPERALVPQPLLAHRAGLRRPARGAAARAGRALPLSLWTSRRFAARTDRRSSSPTSWRAICRMRLALDPASRPGDARPQRVPAIRRPFVVILARRPARLESADSLPRGFPGPPRGPGVRTWRPGPGPAAWWSRRGSRARLPLSSTASGSASSPSRRARRAWVAVRDAGRRSHWPDRLLLPAWSRRRC